MTKRDALVDDLKNRYERLGTLQAVADELGNVVSPARIYQVINGQGYSPRLARAVGIEKKRIRLAAEFRDVDERARFCALYNIGPGEGQITFTQWVKRTWTKDALSYLDEIAERFPTQEKMNAKTRGQSTSGD